MFFMKTDRLLQCSKEQLAESFHYSIDLNVCQEISSKPNVRGSVFCQTMMSEGADCSDAGKLFHTYDVDCKDLHVQSSKFDS